VSVLQARRREEEARRSQGPAWGDWLEPAAAVAAGLVYLADALGRVLALFR
jgi:hypothetical protein